MFAAISCLEQHDLSLVSWAALICVISVIAGLGVYRRALRTRGPLRLGWITTAALLLGAGVWATHFMAMLAYHKELKIGFGPGVTLISLIAAIAGTGLGVGLAANKPSLAGRLAGGAICGGGIALMHFVGVAALRLPAAMVWNRPVAAEAIAIGILGAAAAFAVAGPLDRLARWAGGGGLLVAAIVGLHFTAMGAVTLIPDASVVNTGPFGRGELALGVIALSGLIVLAGGGLVAMDRISARSTLASMRIALGCTPSPLATFDPEGRLSYWNESYGELIRHIGLAAERGLRFDTLLAMAARRGLPGAQAMSLKDVLETANELRQPFQAGDGRWYQPRLGPTHDGGFVSLLTDVTLQQSLRRREIEAREAAEAANRAKSEFLANMSHEIRTPLNAILGMTTIIRRTGLDARQSSYLDAVAEAGHTLQGILTNVLDLTKIEAGLGAVGAEPFDLRESLRHTTGAYAALAADKKVDFHLELAPSAEGAWIGDESKIHRVLENLLSNAVKFTEHGEISLTVSTTDDGLCFIVRDTGMGVAADKADLIFDRFTQADASSTRRFGGAGLGLAISRRLAELMGGTLTMQSAEQQGSTFALRLPLSRTAAVDPIAPVAELDGAPSDRLRILAAEDNAVNQMVLNALLEPLGAEITMVANGREAVEAFDRYGYDLVLMDIQMPEMGGVQATQEIRLHEQARGLARTPIVAVTANVMHHQIDGYFAAGMDGFVAKPIQMGALITAMQAAIAGESRASGRPEPEQRIGAA